MLSHRDIKNSSSLGEELSLLKSCATRCENVMQILCKVVPRVEYQDEFSSYFESGSLSDACHDINLTIACIERQLQGFVVGYLLEDKVAVETLSEAVNITANSWINENGNKESKIKNFKKKTPLLRGGISQLMYLLKHQLEYVKGIHVYIYIYI